MGVFGGLRVGLCVSIVLAGSVVFGRGDHDGSSIQIHLNYAREAMQNQQFEIAQAHADLVLMPRAIRIFVSGSSNLQTEVETVTRLWTEILNKEVKFEFVSSKSRADVVILFADHLQHENRHVGGLLQWRRRVHQMPNDQLEYRLSATMTIRTNSTRGGEMPQSVMRAALMHEFGHILGLEDSTKQTDLMGPISLSNPVQMPTVEEIAALKALRREATELRRECELRASSRLGKYN